MLLEPVVVDIESIPGPPYASELFPAHFEAQSESARSCPPPAEVSIVLAQKHWMEYSVPLHSRYYGDLTTVLSFTTGKE